MESPLRLRLSDYLLVGFFCAMLFGYAAFGGRPLTMHEARLPETSREMLQTHEWLLPTSGGRPWLERPPLPHWIVTSAMRLFDRTDQVWVVRLPSGFMGLVTVLLTMWMAGRFFGRNISVLSGLVLATSFEFYTYSCLAEDDVYLAALVAIAAALFCRAGISPAPSNLRWYDFFTWRSPAILGFFFVLGVTNITKGPLLGIVILGTPVAVFSFWQAIVDRAWQPVLRFSWLWGWLVMIGLTIAWPLWAYHRYPDVLENWRYDYLGRVSGTYSDINQPWFYYLLQLPQSLLPWTPACLIGLLATIFDSRGRKPRFAAAVVSQKTGASAPGYQGEVDAGQFASQRSATRFFICWAIVPLLVLSIPKGKHHHYLVPFIAPWAVLGAIGLREIGRFILTPRGSTWWRNPWLAMLTVGLPGGIAIVTLHHRIPEPLVVTIALALFWIGLTGCIIFAIRERRGPLLMGSCVIALLVGYCWGETMVAGGTDHTLDDTAFLLRVRSEVPANLPLFINGKLGPAGNLDFFRTQFYSRPDAKLLHNLSFLRDEKITDPVVYVITRERDENKLKQLGTATEIDQSPLSHDLPDKPGRFTLFRLTFDPRLVRYPLPAKITSLQAMERADGPWCGPRI